MTKPLVGISANQRLNIALDDLPWTYALAGFSDAVMKANATPILLPIGNEETAKQHVSLVDKIILIGGQNVDPKFYNQSKEAFDDDFFLERDVYEIAIINEARRQGKPILGICRGLQLMNVILGGTLNQNIPNHWQKMPSDSYHHDIITNKDSFLFSIYGEKASINSFHHQSIKELGNGLEVISRDPRDNTIEAVVSNDPTFQFIGVQWHPELLQHISNADFQLFDYFINTY
ncbi:gamma-glutamyl-gamma-aminobutyrate hydrolase family protein [Streptococcus hongkongensis]|nr:gamma-glutamyl hydrolase [Streptococcus uberis]